MEPKRYWWMSATMWNDQKRIRIITLNTVVEVHPFSTLKSLQKAAAKGDHWELNSWQLISVEEYNLWQELNNSNQ